MLKKLYKLKNLEELLGVIGLIYFALMATLTVVLVKFIVEAMRSSFDVKTSDIAPPPRFQLELLEQIIEQQKQ